MCRRPLVIFTIAHLNPSLMIPCACHHCNASSPFKLESTQRALEGPYPYVWLDAKDLKMRDGDRVTSMACVVAIGVTPSGNREVLGFDIGLSEVAPFWVTFLQDLVSRGLRGVQWVFRDVHTGIQAALRQILQRASGSGAACAFLVHVPKHVQTVVSARVRSIFGQPVQDTVRAELARVVESRFPKAVSLLADAQDDILAYRWFPPEHGKHIASTNPLERLHLDIGRRCRRHLSEPGSGIALGRSGPDRVPR